MTRETTKCRESKEGVIPSNYQPARAIGEQKFKDRRPFEDICWSWV
jgi:hypothetical protein